MSRSTPWVDGCCGPMLMIIVSSSLGSWSLSVFASASEIRSTHAHLAQQLLRGASASARPHLLLALSGRSPDASCTSMTLIARSSCRTPLNCTGIRPIGVVLAERVADPVVGHEDPVRSGWPSNVMPNMSYASRSIASVPG